VRGGRRGLAGDLGRRCRSGGATAPKSEARGRLFPATGGRVHAIECTKENTRWGILDTTAPPVLERSCKSAVLGTAELIDASRSVRTPIGRAAYSATDEWLDGELARLLGGGAGAVSDAPHHRRVSRRGEGYR
jgi:hypothetical protein